MKIKNYIDNFYYVVFNSLAIFCLTFLVWLVFLQINSLVSYSAIILLVGLAFITYFFYCRFYILDDDYLLINIGGFIKKCDYRDIKKCYITSNSKFSYATSKKRICIKIKDKEIFISPEKIDEVLFKLINKTGGK